MPEHHPAMLPFLMRSRARRARQGFGAAAQPWKTSSAPLWAADPGASPSAQVRDKQAAAATAAGRPSAAFPPQRSSAAASPDLPSAVKTRGAAFLHGAGDTSGSSGKARASAVAWGAEDSQRWVRRASLPLQREDAQPCLPAAKHYICF